MWTTTKMTLAAGAAALALAAAPAAFAQGKGDGNGGGNGNGNGGGQSAQAKGNGGGKADRGNGGGKADRGNGGGKADRGGPPVRADRGNGGGQDRNMRAEGGNRGNSGKSNGNPVVRGNNGNGNGNGNADRYVDRGRDYDRRDGVNVDVRYALPQLRQAYGTRSQLIDGCPPGLAKKNNGCLPPGQAKQMYGSYNPGFFGLYADRGDYYYRDGYLLRYRPDGLAGYIPLLAGALGIGNVWPSYYQPRPIPQYYDDYYGFDDSYGYRYADNVIYRVDPESAAILGVTALLTGDDITIGQPMPRGYDVYNVPYGYRDQYYDRPDARYRYSDGYVYQIDPESALVVAAIELLS